MRTPLLAWPLGAVGALSSLAVAVLAVSLSAAAGVLMFAACVIVGLVLALRRPDNLVGWFLLAGGTGFALHAAAVEYAVHALASGASYLPGGVLAAWIAEWAWIPGFSFLFIGLPYVYPEGRLPSRRLRPLAWAAVALPSTQLVARATGPTLGGFLEDTASGVGVSVPMNPIGAEWAQPLTSLVDGLMELAFFPFLVGGIVALVLRYRRGDRVTRLQIRWLLTSIGLLALCFLLSTAIDVPEILFVAAIAGLPVAIGLAVMRHRLYDMDRIIGRTVSYGIVTGVLVGVYAVGVLGIGGLVRAATAGDGHSDLVVAASTLAVAAAFGPVRRRVQTTVDRRFDRARYDAARTLDAFGARLRDQLDPETLGQEIQAITARTFQSHTAVWLAGVGR